jgi:hypothetical protein
MAWSVHKPTDNLEGEFASRIVVRQIYAFRLVIELAVVEVTQTTNQYRGIRSSAREKRRQRLTRPTVPCDKAASGSVFEVSPQRFRHSDSLLTSPGFWSSER